MRPSLPDGSYGLFRAVRRPAIGDVVLADHPEFGLIVKKVAAVATEGIELEGTDDRSTTRQRIGTLPGAAILAKLVLTLHRNRHM